MTKLQMTAAVESVLAQHKAKPALTEAMMELLEEYASSNKGATNKITQDVTIDGVEYRWCNRHEIYEPIVNFANNKKTTVCCKLGAKHWAELGKEIKALNDDLMAKALEGEDVSQLAKELNEKKEIRGGRYSWEGTAMMYPEVADYIYGEENYIKLEDIK